MVTAMSMDELQRSFGTIRRTLKQGGQIEARWRDRPLARVISAEEYDQLTTELEQLRARIDELEQGSNQREVAA